MLSRKIGQALPESRLASMRQAAAHLDGQLVLALAQVDDMPEQTIRGPLDVTNLYDHLRAHPMDPLSTSGEPKRLPRGGGIAIGIFSTAKG